VRLWQELDSRTRSNLQSCLLNALRPLLSPAAARCFGPRSPAVFTPALSASEGRICVVSVNALAEPDLARFLFRLAKQSFFDAVQQRRTQPDRLCGLIADEFPLVVTPEDVEQLATVRSKRCFVIAATQGLHALIERVGVGPARSLVNHFNTTIYLRTREAETAVQAHLVLGTRQVRVHRRGKDEGGFLGLMVPPSQKPAMTEVPVCPLGALGQLSPHQAYLVYADGRRTEFPVWFIPWFEAVARPVSGPAPKAASKFTAEHVRQLMQRAGFRPRWSPEVVMSATAICRRRRRKTLLHAVAFFLSKCCLVPEGLETLPNCWLAALPGILWSTRRKHWIHQAGVGRGGFVAARVRPGTARARRSVHLVGSAAHSGQRRHLSQPLAIVESLARSQTSAAAPGVAAGSKCSRPGPRLIQAGNIRRIQFQGVVFAGGQPARSLNP